MNTSRNTARIVGVLFIIGTVAGILALMSTGALREPDYLVNVSANESQIITGVLLVLVMGISLAPVPVLLFPILRRHSEPLALGYVVFRVLEVATYILTMMGMLLLLTLSQTYVQAGAPDPSSFRTFGTLLQVGTDVWVNNIRLIVFSMSVLILNYALYRSNLIPRWLSGWGLVAGVLHLVEGLLGMYGSLAALGAFGSLLFVPILIQEMVWAVWLIVKGFNPTAIASLMARTDTNPHADGGF